MRTKPQTFGHMPDLDVSTWEEIGKFARVIFFIAAAGLMFLWLQTTDWTFTHTPLSQLTIAILADGIGKVVLAFVFVWIWVIWFSSGGKGNYRAWAWVGVLMTLALSLYLGSIHQS